MVHITVPEVVDNLSLLLIRIVVGVSFIVASKNKAKNIKGFAKKNGLPVPFASFIALAEMLGGIAIALGFLAQFAALGLMLLMIGTITKHIFKWKSPYWASKGGWEYDLMLFALCSVILINSTGSIALMH